MMKKMRLTMMNEVGEVTILEYDIEVDEGTNTNMIFCQVDILDEVEEEAVEELAEKYEEDLQYFGDVKHYLTGEGDIAFTVENAESDIYVPGPYGTIWEDMFFWKEVAIKQELDEPEWGDGEDVWFEDLYTEAGKAKFKVYVNGVKEQVKRDRDIAMNNYYDLDTFRIFVALDEMLSLLGTMN